MKNMNENKTDISLDQFNETMKHKAYIDKVINTIQTKDVKKLIKFAMNKPIWLANFSNSPVTIDEHHNYHGGLVIHTAEVLKGALELAKFKNLSTYETDLVIAAAILHDFGATYENVVYIQSDNDKVLVKIAKTDIDKYEFNKSEYPIRMRYTVRLLDEFFDKHRDEIDTDTLSAIEIIIKSSNGITNWNSCRSVFYDVYASSALANKLKIFLFLPNLHSKIVDKDISILKTMEEDANPNEKAIIKDRMSELKEMWELLEKQEKF